MSIYTLPPIGPPEERVLDLVRAAWKDLHFSLNNQPHRWSGTLRRSAFARGVRGSNSIEGFVVSDDDAMAAIAGEEPFDASAETWDAITGYRNAMTYVLRLGTDPHATIDATLLRSLHFMMCGYDLKVSPGSWRDGDIFVVDSEGTRVYEGPPAERVAPLVGELIAELAVQHPNESPMLTAAMAHLNLVMIHPFRDGNGRMSRCLQTLVLARAGVYDPLFCSVEEYLGRNTPEYYRVLASVGDGSWSPDRSALEWIRFMLRAHYTQAATFQRRLRETSAVWAEVEAVLEAKRLPDRGAAAVVEAAFGQRIRSVRYCEHANVSPNLASRDLARLVGAGLLVKHGKKRGTWYERSDALLAVRDRHRLEQAIADPFTL